MQQDFESHVRILIERFDQAMDATQTGVVAIHSGQQVFQFLDDCSYPFAVNPHFNYWCPLSEHPDCWLIYRTGHRPRLIYFMPDDCWHLSPGSPSGYWVDSFDIVVIRQPEDFTKHLGVPVEDITAIGETDRLPNPGFRDVNPEPLLNHLHYQRAVKTDYEINCLSIANQIAVRGHVAARRGFEAGMSEFDINQQYILATRQTENQLPYGNIVGLNEHCAVLHYQQQDTNAPEEHRSFLIDAGACFAGYASDITRTWSNGHELFDSLLAQMDVLQQQLVVAVKPGVDFRHLHLQAHDLIADLLESSGLVRLPAAEIVDRGISRLFFPHGLGHFLGLQVHDVGGFQRDERGGEIDRPENDPFLRLTRILAPGHVVTIEPGLYIIPLLLEPCRSDDRSGLFDWQMIDALTPYGGIRIEDDVLITESNPINLSRESFATDGD